MLPRNRVSATILTPELILNALSKGLGCRNFGLPDLQKAAIPAVGVEWNREVTIGFTAARLNNIA